MSYQSYTTNAVVGRKDYTIGVLRLSTNVWRARTKDTVNHVHGRTFIFADGASEELAIGNLRSALSQIARTGYAPVGAIASV
jgi:hypothetical protein